jgi:hypothetical protein
MQSKNGIMLLEGAIDIHVHCTPDVVKRKQDYADMAREAAMAGMAGVLIKDHTTSTVGRVYGLNRTAAGGLRFFSALALNPPVGGINPSAVESALLEGADVIYFPTYGAKNHISIWGRGKPPTAFPLPDNYEGDSIFDKDGNLIPECQVILEMISNYDAVLATGHLSPEESLSLIKLGRQLGVKRMVITHASEPITLLSSKQQKEAAALGAFIEHSLFAVTKCMPDPITLEEFSDHLRQTGVGNTILSTDFGQKNNPAPVEGFAYYLGKLKDIGFSEDEIKTMVCDNPRKLLMGRSYEIC